MLMLNGHTDTKVCFGEAPRPACEARALPNPIDPRNPRFRSVFAEKQFVDAVEDFFDANGCGEEAVAGKNSA
jgi:hypothetical protein